VADDVRLQSASASSREENARQLLGILAWPLVLVPVAWGVSQPLVKAVAIFRPARVVVMTSLGTDSQEEMPQTQ
jgi:hypothetical protein